MAELMQEHWLFVVAIVVALLAVIVWLRLARRRTRVSFGRSGDGPARRNQSLIDAPPVAPVAPMRAVERPVEPPVPPPSAAAAMDDLCRIKGVGPKLKQQLYGMGITTFARIAAWDEADIDRVDAQLGRFEGRIRRDDWRSQAALLAADDLAGYEARFGKL